MEQVDVRITCFVVFFGSSRCDRELFRGELCVEGGCWCELFCSQLGIFSSRVAFLARLRRVCVLLPCMVRLGAGPVYVDDAVVRQDGDDDNTRRYIEEFVFRGYAKVVCRGVVRVMVVLVEPVILVDREPFSCVQGFALVCFVQCVEDEFCEEEDEHRGDGLCVVGARIRVVFRDRGRAVIRFQVAWRG